MYKNILRKINFGFYLLITLMIVVVQSTIFGYYPLQFIQPDLFLILCVYVGFKRSPIEGGLLVYLGALIMEAHSGAADSYFLASYLYAFLIATVLSRTVVVPDLFSSIWIVTGLSVLKRLGLILLLGMQGRAQNELKHFFIYLLPTVLVQGALTPLCFAWFQRVDLKTYKDDHAEDEYDLNAGF